MPRRVDIPQQVFVPNDGAAPLAFRVDGFNSANADALEFVLNFTDWPTDTSLPVLRVEIRWDTGGGGGATWNGGPFVRFGVPVTSISARFPVQHDAGGKRAVSGGDLAMIVYRQFSGSATFRAV